MSVKLESTTDSAEAVTAALGSLAQKTEEKVEEKKSASATEEEQDETAEESETSEEESEEKEAPDSDEEESDEDESKLKDDKKKRSMPGFKRRIDKLNSKLTAKEQEAEYWKAEALKQRQGKSAEDQALEKPEAKSKSVADSGQPKEEDFETHRDYLEALTDWKVDQKLKAREESEKLAKLKSEQQKQVQTFQEKVTEFKNAHQDFDEVMDDVDDIPMAMAVQEVVLSAENGPELMYELAKNRDEYEKICKLPYHLALREIGKFEAKLQASESSKQEEKKKVTKAPPPLQPLKAKGSAGSVKNPEDMDYQQYKKWREQQRA